MLIEILLACKGLHTENLFLDSLEEVDKSLGICIVVKLSRFSKGNILNNWTSGDVSLTQERRQEIILDLQSECIPDHLLLQINPSHSKWPSIKFINHGMYR